MRWEAGDQVRGRLAEGPRTRLDGRQLQRRLQAAGVWGGQKGWPGVSSGLICFPRHGSQLFTGG